MSIYTEPAMGRNGRRIHGLHVVVDTAANWRSAPLELFTANLVAARRAALAAAPAQPAEAQP